MAAVIPSLHGTDGFETKRVSTPQMDQTQAMSSEEHIQKYLQGLRSEYVNNEHEGFPMKGTYHDYHETLEYFPEEKSFNEEAIANGHLANQDEAGESSSQTDENKSEPNGTMLRLSPRKIYKLTSSPKWLPIKQKQIENVNEEAVDQDILEAHKAPTVEKGEREGAPGSPVTQTEGEPFGTLPQSSTPLNSGKKPRPTSRTVSTPLLRRRSSFSKGVASSKSHHASISKHPKVPPLPLRFDKTHATVLHPPIESPEPSPMPQSMPIPPLSLPTYLQLELSAQRPSPLFIHRSVTSDFPYESSRVKIDRLKNFFYLPLELEQILWFGALACLDAWLFSFTILPLRFLKALLILGQSLGGILLEEVSLLYVGIGRLWRRKRQRSTSAGPKTTLLRENPKVKGLKCSPNAQPKIQEAGNESRRTSFQQTGSPIYNDSNRKHQRKKTIPSKLEPEHRADILKGLLILFSCIILMYFDASRMYHGIRGQAAIKLYVIYNVLEVCDRLFSALGQDVLECLFSKEALERRPDGRSKVLRPAWLFMLALCYNVIHSTALFYQVITLNVAVNSYSNALLTLLMSNQFVEIKSTVFKKFEKENLFQLTCADVVERFQLWLMLTIIASRNIIETGGLSLAPAGSTAGEDIRSTILPKSFTIFPEWTGQVMGPFFLVLGSEMLVDWIKHAYITKFNMTKPGIYGRFLDILAKDYYSNAFVDQNLTRRLGLPVIPLSCLFIRASVQTYHMFLATHMPVPLPSTATSISLESASASPATTAAIQHIDQIFRRALGRSTFGIGDSSVGSSILSIDNVVAFVTIAILFLVLYLVLLAFKLILGMTLLSYARHRYKGMKQRESISVHAEGRRVGGWGVVEVDEDKRRWIYNDDPDGARKLRERERNIAEKEKRIDKEGRESFAGVSRYSMAAKRIW